MEEWEKRKQRLRALRTEADQVRNERPEATGNNGDQSGPTIHLSNPLLETNEAQQSYSTPRFDFYTDPIAAFSGNRQRSGFSSQNSRDRFLSHGIDSNPAPRMQFPPSSGTTNLEDASTHVNERQNSIFSHQAMKPIGDPHHNAGPMNSEITPPHIHQPWNNSSCSPRMYQTGHPNVNLFDPCHLQQNQNHHLSNRRMHQIRPPYLTYGTLRSPMPMMSPYSIEQGAPYVSNSSSNEQHCPSQTLRGSGVASSYYSGNSHMVSLGPSTGYNLRGSPHFSIPYQHKGQDFTSSPSSGIGYGGRGSPCFGGGSNSWERSTHRSPSSGCSGGRATSLQVGSEDHGFFFKSMVEDPWKYLEPIEWTKVNISKMPSKYMTPQSSRDSHAIKKPRVSNAFDNSSSRQSLADYLADAFNEAVEDTVAV